MDAPPPTPDPEFGPSGYLPGRAAKRARKIVLRAPLGLQWIVASVVFGATVLVAGLLFLRSSGPPGEPYVATVALADVVADVEALPEVEGTLVLAGGKVTVLATTKDLTYCAEARRLLGVDGGVWGVDGRGYGVPSLRRYATTVHDGVVYVDPTTRLAAPPPGDATELPDCS